MGPFAPGGGAHRHTDRPTNTQTFCKYIVVWFVKTLEKVIITPGFSTKEDYWAFSYAQTSAPELNLKQTVE